MFRNWRISTLSGALLAAYFIPVWTIVAFRIMVSPIHGLFEQPNVSVALFVSDYLQLAAMATVRVAWLLALGRLTVVAFFAIFLVSTVRGSIRRSGGGDEALAIAIAIGSVISFASMVMASRVGEAAALQLHATELLMLLGTAIVMLCERPREPQSQVRGQVAEKLSLQQSQLLDNR
jgi:4-amino-4-deoxy-L-arabinose transferase-like glycosyltransferase